MPTFTVQAAAKKKDIPDSGRGAKQVIVLTLVDGDQPPVIAEWFTAAATPIPTTGSTLEGTVEPSEYGPKFKKAGGFSGGGGGGRPRTPEERKSIQMQHAQKCAVDALRLAAEFGDYKPPDAADVVGHVKTIASGLFQQIEEVAA